MPSFWRQPVVVAAYRALGGAVVLAGAAYFGALAAGQPLRAAGISAGVAFFAYLSTRGVIEGLVDQTRATTPPLPPANA